MKSWIVYALLALGIPTVAYAASHAYKACCPIPGCPCSR